MSRHRLKVLTVVLNNTGYESLRSYERANLQHLDPRAHAFDLPGLDLVNIATGFGVPAKRIVSVDELPHKLMWGTSLEGPALLDITIR